MAPIIARILLLGRLLSKSESHGVRLGSSIILVLRFQANNLTISKLLEGIVLVRGEPSHVLNKVPLFTANLLLADLSNIAIAVAPSSVRCSQETGSTVAVIILMPFVLRLIARVPSCGSSILMVRS